MAALTLERVLSYAEGLPEEEQEMLESLLRKRRVELWRRQTAADAKLAVKKFRAGKLNPESVESVLARLRDGLSG